MDEDPVRLRMSLAIAPSLPAGECERLLDEVAELRRTRAELAEELDTLAHQLDRVRNRLRQT